ncbi:RNA helicase [Babesia ovis]|uniref:ATP-dependent RNA helicase n=1 Tax=Babesia ovis TaxID=5869 RepID=A0A9W5WUG8_BABOV|nr:RNA helicase [Babesia ovis]
MVRAFMPKSLLTGRKPTPNHTCYPLTRAIPPFPTDVRVWGSSLIELKPHLMPVILKRSTLAFNRRFKRVRLIVNGRKVSPNGIQLATLRPQLAGGDLLIASPQHSGKTLLYLLPEAIRQTYAKEKGCYVDEYKILVLVPTLDLVLLGSRSAVGILRERSNVLPLYYKDVVNGQYKNLIPLADTIYTTPQCALKALLKAPNLFKDVRILILDEVHRLLKAQSASVVLRLKSLLLPDIQTIALAPRNDHMLREIVSRALRVDMKIISFCPEYDIQQPVTRHIWGPQRSSKFSMIADVDINETLQVEHTNTLEQKVHQNRLRIIEHSRTKDVFVDRAHQCEYLLYEPSKLCRMIYWVLNQGTKTVLFFPTVRMTQFCYVYFKHYLQFTRPLYTLHGGLSPEKRRYTIDLFSTIKEGVLFCTDLASLGLNLGNIDLVVHVCAPESIDILSDRVNTAHGDSSDIKNILLLHDLDAHVLYEASEHNCDIKPIGDNSYKEIHFEVQSLWVENSCYLASCELMYRSLIGYYCNQAFRLKFQRWQVPSLVNDMVSSFGFKDTFSVTRQFASRLQLWDAPGLVIERKAPMKTELQAAAAGYPGFRSRLLQTNTENVDYHMKRNPKLE